MSAGGVKGYTVGGRVWPFRCDLPSIPIPGLVRESERRRIQPMMMRGARGGWREKGTLRSVGIICGNWGGVGACAA